MDQWTVEPFVKKLALCSQFSNPLVASQTRNRKKVQIYINIFRACVFRYPAWCWGPGVKVGVTGADVNRAKSSEGKILLQGCGDTSLTFLGVGYLPKSAYLVMALSAPKGLGSLLTTWSMKLQLRKRPHRQQDARQKGKRTDPRARELIQSPGALHGYQSGFLDGSQIHAFEWVPKCLCLLPLHLSRRTDYTRPALCCHMKTV